MFSTCDKINNPVTIPILAWGDIILHFTFVREITPFNHLTRKRVWAHIILLSSGICQNVW